MAKPRIFISSTFYDLKHIRASLDIFIESLGYEPILSEKGRITYTPDQPLDESCYREVTNSDVFVLIIGGRYGSEVLSAKSKSSKEFYDRYESITKHEYQSALTQDIPIYILIEKGVYADYETYLHNKNNESVRYAHADSVNIFKLIEFILTKPRNNPIQQFDKYSDIEDWLRDQWAGLFRELISRMANERQLSSLTSQVSELKEINQTLKRYLEEVVLKISPDSSAKLIQTETERLSEARKMIEFEDNKIIHDLIDLFRIPRNEVYSALREEKTIYSFMKRVIKHQPKGHSPILIIKNVVWDNLLEPLNEARSQLGLDPFRTYKPKGSKAKTKTRTNQANSADAKSRAAD